MRPTEGQKEELLCVAGYMRKGYEKFPEKCTGVLFSEDGKACALGCVVAAIKPEYASSEYNRASWDLLKDKFPVLMEVPEGFPDLKQNSYDKYQILTWIWQLNDSQDLPVLEIATKVEQLAKGF